MANCLNCGAQLPAFTIGESSPLCRNCRAQVELGAAQPRASARRDLWSDLPPAGISRSRWFSATYILLAINGAVFLAMVATGISIIAPGGEDLIRWGSDFGPLTLGGQYWRSVTSTFIHIGIIHLALNMWCLLALAQPLERLLGRLTTFLVYLVTGAGASLLSLGWNPLRNSAGASGAIFGIAGVLISFFYLAKLDLPPERIKGILGWVVRFAVMNLIIGLAWRINNMAHLGGLITGLVLGGLFALAHTAPAEERQARQLLALASVAAILAASLVLIVKTRTPAIEMYNGQVALLRPDYPAAITHFRRVIALQPNDPTAHGSLGYALAGLHRYDEALQEYQRALALQPGFSWVEVNMAATLLGQGHPEEALLLFRKNANRVEWDSEDHLYYGEALRLTGGLGAAEIEFRKAIQLAPKDARPHQLLANLYRQMGRNNEAAAEDKQAHDLDIRKK